MSIHVNDREISSRDINIESAHHQESGADPRFAQRRAAVALTVRELLRQRAEQLDMSIGDGPEAMDNVIEELIRLEVDLPTADTASCRRWYEQNPEQFSSPDLAEIRHILLAAMPEDLEARSAARVAAEDLIRELRQDPGAFPRLARLHSRCPSAADGGHLGQVSRGETVPEFEDAVRRLPVGLAESPIKTRYGFHVVEVLQRVPGRLLPFEAVSQRIADYLQERTRRRAISQYIRLLAGQAQIRGIDLDVPESALIQ